MNPINNIYIMSKNRPECHTAKLLNEMDYPGEWFICVQEDEEFLEEYIDNYSEEKIIKYNYYNEIENSLFDNFNNDRYGASCARNGVHNFIKRHFEDERYWLLDDDITSFSKSKSNKPGSKKITSGEELEKILYDIAMIGKRANLEAVGIGADINRFPLDKNTVEHSVYYIYNRRVDSNISFHGRVADDYIFNVENYHKLKNYLLRFEMFNVKLKPFNYNQIQQDGGMAETYKMWDTVNQRAYQILINPRLKILIRNDGTLGNSNTMKTVCPKLISEKWKR